METVISSRQNAGVRLIRELLRSRRARDESGVIAAEGDHLCGELVRSGIRAVSAVYTQRAAEKYPNTVRQLLDNAKSSFVITDELAEYISDTKAPQGLFATARRPEFSLTAEAKRVIVLDGVQDPGNVGTIIRTAEALGMDGAVLCGNCADMWSPKTLRASMGSAFRFPVVMADYSDIGSLLSGFEMYAAMLDRSALKLGEVEFNGKAAIVIGSEGSGISEEMKNICSRFVFIPIRKAESLNAAVAAAILMWAVISDK